MAGHPSSEKTLRDLVLSIDTLAGNLASESTLQSAIAELQDILLELTAKVNDGGTINLSPADLTALEAITATVIGLPSDYPDAATHTTLVSILAALGTTLTVAGSVSVSNFPATQPVSGTVTVTNPGLTDTQLRASAVPVSGTIALSTTDFPDSTSGTKLDTLHTDNGSVGTSPPSIFGSGILGYLRSSYDKLAAIATSVAGTQLMKVTNGAQAADTVAGDTGQNVLLMAPGRKEVPFTTTSVVNTTATDVSNYASVSVHIVSQGTGSTITYQGSNDGTNWVAVTMVNAGATVTAPATSDTAAGIIRKGPLGFRWFRLAITGISAGTTAGLIEFSTLPPTFPVVASATQLPAAAAMADSVSNPTAPAVDARLSGLSGSSWDRIRAGVRTFTSNTGILNAFLNPTPATALASKTTTGAGGSLDSSTVYTAWSLQVITASGSPSTVKVNLELSLDGTSFTSAGVWDTAGGQTLGDTVFVTGKAARYARANVITLSGTSTPAITAFIAGAV